MYSQIQRMGLKAYSVAEVPPLAASLLFAETFYKFHSFTLECLAFLATWYVTSLGYARLIAFVTARR